VIFFKEICVEVTMIRWEPFLLNQFLLECLEDKGMEFNYPWLLIFLAFIALGGSRGCIVLGAKREETFSSKVP
jgi:hypothetical protein